MQAGVEHNQIRQLANLKRSVNRPLIASGMGANRHPLVIGLPCSTHPLKEIAFAWVMVLGATVPSIVR